MNIEDAIMEKRHMEEKIISVISGIVTDFNKSTGLNVSSINIETLESTAIGESRKQFVLCRVQTTVEI
jgi:hypothetical protein